MTYEEALNTIAGTHLQLDGIDPRVNTQADGTHLQYENSIWTIKEKEHGVVTDSKTFNDTEEHIDECLKGINKFLFNKLGNQVDTDLLKKVVLQMPKEYSFNW